MGQVKGNSRSQAQTCPALSGTRKTQCYHFRVGASPEESSGRPPCGEPGRSATAGYVLVGGGSSRMGRDKALLDFRGASLAETVAATVAEAAGSATLVGSPDRYAQLPYAAIPDLYPGEGPLGGILTALRHSHAEWNLIVACDMPEVDPQVLKRLMEAAQAADCAVLIPVADGRPQPLCGVYGRKCEAALEAEFARGVRKVTAALDAAGCVRLPMEETRQFQNVNTPEDWAAYAAR